MDIEQQVKLQPHPEDARKFVIEVKFCQNGTWQGMVRWGKTQQEQHFRSALELLKMMDSAIDSVAEAQKA